MSESGIDPGQQGPIGSELSEAEQIALRHWRESMTLLDGRYHDKVVLKLVARAMGDAEFRARLVADTDAVLGELEEKLPEGIHVRFLANTPTTLNVVLPPVAAEIERQPEGLRDALTSRTSLLIESYDDYDPWDKGGVDPPIFGPGPIKVPPEDNDGRDAIV
jgi:hypothetical protein